jgi:type IV fimbrial biogenesis protein FimT
VTYNRAVVYERWLSQRGIGDARSIWHDDQRLFTFRSEAAMHKLPHMVQLESLSSLERRTRSLGFTLIELMVTVSIAAILAMLAAPSFSDFVIRNKSAAIANEFSGSVLRARNEAVTRNMCTSMCKSSTVSAGTPVCDGSGAGWQTGWLVFRNPTCNPANLTPATTELVSVVDSLDAAYSLTFTGTSADGVIFFSATGNPRTADAGGFDLQYLTTGTTRTSNRRICLSALGRTATITYGDPC